MMPIDPKINENLNSVVDNIKKAAETAQRNSQDVTLVAVSKTHPAETVVEALAAGHRVLLTMAAHAWKGVCNKRDGCVLPASHRGTCKEGVIEEEDYEVEDILEQRGHGSTAEYLIKWKDWPEEDSTWEPESALSQCVKVLDCWRVRQTCPVQSDPSVISYAAAAKRRRTEEHAQLPRRPQR